MKRRAFLRQSAALGALPLLRSVAGVATPLVRIAPGAPLRVNGVQVDAMSMFGAMIWILFLWFIVPVLGVFYGTSLIADEVDDKTITYLFTLPVRRGAVVVGKYIAYLLCTSLAVLPALQPASQPRAI